MNRVVHAVRPILFSTTNRTAGTKRWGVGEGQESTEQDKRNCVNSVNRVSLDRWRWHPFREPGGG